MSDYWFEILLALWVVAGWIVSGNRRRRAKRIARQTEKMTGSGPMWEQDTVMDEVFEEDF